MHHSEVTENILKLRKTLHRKIVSRMRELDFCTSPKIIENFKRWYLWDFHNVETSRSLSEEQLKNAINNLQLIRKEAAVSSISVKFTGYNSDRDLLRCSDGQVKNIHAVGLYQLNMSKDSLKKYIEKTLKRDVYLWDLTTEEAHQCIKRLEEWEAKVLMEKKAS